MYLNNLLFLQNEQNRIQYTYLLYPTLMRVMPNTGFLYLTCPQYKSFFYNIK